VRLDWGRPYLLLRFGLKRPGRRWQQRAGTCYDVFRSSTRYGQLQESRAIANHSPPQLGDRGPKVESASKHPLPFRLSERWVPPLHLSPEASSHRDSFFAATPPSFTMSPIIWCAPGSQGSFTPPFPPGPFHPITAFTHLESSGPFRRSGHNDAQSNRQRGKPVRIGTAVEQPKVFHRSTVK
jgi:hypothetical protein